MGRSSRDVWLLVAALGALGVPGACAAAESPAAALRCPERRCTYVGGGQQEHQYEVDGEPVYVDYLAGSYFSVKCSGAAVLESPGMPRAPAALAVTRVTLTGCPPPAGSLAAVLAALNVTLVSSPEPVPDPPLGRLVLAGLPREPPLAARHFRGLEHALALHLAAEPGARAAPLRGFLAPLAGLRVLSLQHVALPPDELEAPPRELHTLRLLHAGVTRLPPALARSRALRRLTVASAEPLDAGPVPPALLELDLRSPTTRLRLDAALALRSLSVTNWSEERPPRLARCGALASLQLTAPAVRGLPAGWLAACTALERLVLRYAPALTALPADLLANASALTVLSCNRCALAALPERLLLQAPLLRELTLVGNRALQTLPSGLFAVARRVQLLNLSSNDLTADAVLALAPLQGLLALSLARNPRLGDLCDSTGKSALREAVNLTKLNLSGTAVERVCADWRRDMPALADLDLTHTRVAELWDSELQFERGVESRVLLDGAPVRALGLSAAGYAAALEWPASRAPVQLLGVRDLACDCRMYWTRRAMDAPRGPLRLAAGARCAGGRPLAALAPADMLCADDERGECALAAAPPACACGWRPDGDAAAPALVVRLQCAARGLVAVPRPAAPPAAGRRYELLLAGNRIAELPAAALRPDVRLLDLRNNSLRTVGADAVAALGRLGGALLLAGNPLECSCRAAPLVRALTARAERSDLALATCAGGAPLASAGAECPSAGAWAALAVALLLALALAALGALASRERRLRLKAVLHRWGCAWYAADAPGDEARRYDAFLAFSHRDLTAALQVVARLEPAYRLCVHYRDWVPGRYITEQVAESVQESRRTVALVSRHFLASGWALAEFRQAHRAALLDARPRLVVVLLEEPAALRIDEHLARYLATHTYLQWGDPLFWDKLALALPRPRPAGAAPARREPAGPAPARSGPKVSTEIRQYFRRNLRSGARGRSTASATPTAADETRPVPEDAMRDLKSGLREATSAIRDVQLDVLDVTPDVRNVTLDVQNVPTDVRDVATDVRDVATDVRDVTTDVRDVTIDRRNVTTDVQDVTIDRRNVTTDVQDVTTDVRGVTIDRRNEKTDVRYVTTDVRDVTTDEQGFINDVRDVTTNVRNVLPVQRRPTVPPTSADRSPHPLAIAT